MGKIDWQRQVSEHNIRPMPTSDIVQILLAHDRWATGQILTACQKLGEDDFHRQFEIGPGSLHMTTTHILGAMGTWIATLKGHPITPRLDQDGQRRTPDQLLAILDATAPQLAQEAHRLPLSDTVSRTREGKTHQFTRGAVIAHVVTHGMHHRAQCLNMLRHLGVKPLPPGSVAEWSRLVDSAT